MNAVRTLSLMVATLAVGLVTGVFWLYQHTIMPGLAKADDRTFVAAFQNIDRAIINPWFMICGFIGALVFTLVAGLANIGRKALPWIAIAFVLYLIVVIITVAVNVPLNDEIKAAGDPNQIDVAAVRAAFDESKWRAWNLVRVILCVPAFATLAFALVVHGRSTT